MDWEQITPALTQKLDPKHVKKGGGQFGPKGDYVEGWHAIAEANEIFGFGGWSYEITGLTQDALDLGKDGRGNEQWQAAYTCTVRLVVGEAVRQDVGFGSGFGKKKGDAIEGATKEAVTDALKRCLRTFGNRFGLALYDKSRENVGTNEPAPDIDAIQSRLIGLAQKAKSVAELEEVWKREIEPRRTLHHHDKSALDVVASEFAARKSIIEQPPHEQPETDGEPMYQ